MFEIDGILMWGLLIRFESYQKDSVMKTRQDMGASNYSQPSQSGLTSGNNVGSKLLQKMGWQEGQGLGKTNQGRTTIIEVRSLLWQLSPVLLICVLCRLNAEVPPLA